MIKNRILKYIFTIVLSGLITMHIAKCVFIGPSLNQIVIPIFIILIVAIIKENRSLYFISFLIIAFMAMMTLESPDDLTPGILLFIALLYRGNLKHLIFCITAIPSGYLINSFIFEYPDFYNLPIGILGNFGILLFLYFAVISQPSSIETLSKTTPLDKRQLLILKYLSMDISRKEMPGAVPEKELWKYDIDKFTLDIINSEISKIKKILNLNSEFTLGIWYNKHIKNHKN